MHSDTGWSWGNQHATKDCLCRVDSWWNMGFPKEALLSRERLSNSKHTARILTQLAEPRWVKLSICNPITDGLCITHIFDDKVCKRDQYACKIVIYCGSDAPLMCMQCLGSSYCLLLVSVLMIDDYWSHWPITWSFRTPPFNFQTAHLWSAEWLTWDLSQDLHCDQTSMRPAQICL